MKRLVTILLSIIIICTIAIVLLYVLSNKDIRYTQSFSRHLSENNVIKYAELSINRDSYLAGITSQKVYIGNLRDSLSLLVCDHLMKDVKKIQILIESKTKLSRPIIQIDSPYFYVKDGQMPGILRGRMSDWSIDNASLNIPPFTQAVPLSSTTYAFQGIVGVEGSDSYKTAIGKLQNDSPFVRVNESLLKNNNDTYYNTSGILRYSKELNRLVYVHFYSNQYLQLDSNLNLLHKGKTIDTVSVPKIKLAKVSKDTYTLASPPSLVNKNSCLIRDQLLIQSNLMGINEEKNKFDDASAIDVYNLRARAYQYSFYLPDHKGEKMGGFRVTNGKLFAVYDHYLVGYHFNQDQRYEP